MSTYDQVVDMLNRHRDTKMDIKSLEKFFQAFPDGYGEGDKFIAVSVPNQRMIAKKYFAQSTLQEILKLLESGIHEHRLTALFMLVLKFQKAKRFEEKEAIVNLYLNNLDRVNGWDLVDSSAQHIVGPFLYEIKDYKILDELALSGNLWKQRVSIISTLFLIRKNQFEQTIHISEILLNHHHDLIHKAVGWMLREVGNRNIEVEMNFLDRNAAQMPRTMLRYAIEKFEPVAREKYLNISKESKI